MSTCSICGADKGARKHRWCTGCYNTRRKNRWQSRKIALVKQHGGSCRICGWTPQEPHEYAGLDFHHRDPATKEMAIAGNWILSKRASIEAEKCDLLCARCHRIHHAHREHWNHEAA